MRERGGGGRRCEVEGGGEAAGREEKFSFRRYTWEGLSRWGTRDLTALWARPPL